MREQTRERALRVVAAALLGSGLTPQEMREVTLHLTQDPAFGERLVRIIEAFVENLPRRSEPVEPIPTWSNATADVDAVLRVLRTVDVSNKELVETLRRYVGQAAWTPNPKASRRRILEEFLRTASNKAVAEALVELTRNAVEPDPYVDEIMRRKLRTG